MNKFDVFPKKLTIFSLVILSAIFILLMKVVTKNRELVSSFYTHDVPRMQLYCGASRLMSVNQLLQKPIYVDNNILSLNQQGVLYSLDEMIKLDLSDKEKISSVSSLKSVQQFRSNIAEKGKIISSNDLGDLNAEMQDFIENYLQKKNLMIEKQTQFSKLIVVIGISGIVLFFVLIFYVYYLYKKNLQALTKLTADMEEQRQVSLQSSKLASLGEMAAGIAHEINNPLAIISFTSKVMRKNILKESFDVQAISSSLDDIDTTVLRISKIIKGLRNISRDAAEELMANVLIRDIFEDVLGVCSERFKSNGVVLNIEDPDLLIERNLFCHRVQISQVLLNFLVNAFDAVQAMDVKIITVSLLRKDKMINIIISDSGKGIPVEVRSKLFQPFFTTKDIGKGTGLGLSISKTIIESHQGKIYLDEKSSQTRFVIELPFNP